MCSISFQYFSNALSGVKVRAVVDVVAFQAIDLGVLQAKPHLLLESNQLLVCDIGLHLLPLPHVLNRDHDSFRNRCRANAVKPPVRDNRSCMGNTLVDSSR